MPYRYSNKSAGKSNYNDWFITGNIDSATGTFCKDEVALPTAPPGMLPAIVGFDIKLPKEFVDTKLAQFHISIKDETSIQEIDANQVIEAGGIYCRQASAVGQERYDQTLRLKMAAPVLISQNKIFIGFIQDLVATFVVRYRIHMVWRPSNAPQVSAIGSATQF